MSKLKEHFEKHKTKYIWAGVGAGTAIVLSAVAVVIYVRNNPQFVEVQSNNRVSNVLSYKPHTELKVEVHSRVHPGWVVQDIDTGNIYSSQNEAAKALGVSKSAVSSHLNGKHDSANGHVLQRIAKATVPDSQE